MNRRALGDSGINIPPLVFGGNVFGWTVDQTAAFELLDAMLAHGINAVDTSNFYSKWVPGHVGGESETILGNWLKSRGRRGEVMIATKVGKDMGPGRKGLSRSAIERALEDSLRRLQTDYIDLYQSHEDDPTTPLEETLDAYARLLRQGKVRAIGASNYSSGRLSQALQTSRERNLPRYQSVQPKYNLYDRDDFETSLAPLCADQGVSVICHSALATGFLTGKYRSEKDLEGKARAVWVRSYLNERGQRILGALDQVAARYATTPGKVALAWLMARPGVTAVIASATSLPQLDDLAAAMSLRLDASSIAALDQASAWLPDREAGRAAAGGRS